MAEARKLLLAQVKEQTRRRDALNAQRRRLPMVRVEKAYVFDGPREAVTLARMFGGCRQLIVHHIMFGPDWDEPCPSCRSFMDELSAGVQLPGAKTSLAQRLRARARERWPQIASLQIRHRGMFSYIDATLTD